MLGLYRQEECSPKWENDLRQQTRRKIDTITDVFACYIELAKIFGDKKEKVVSFKACAERRRAKTAITLQTLKYKPSKDKKIVRLCPKRVVMLHYRK
jgi:hypothetical protein